MYKGMSSFHLLPVKMKSPLLLVFILASLLSIAHSHWKMDHESHEIPTLKEIKLVKHLRKSDRYLLTSKLIVEMVNWPEWKSLSDRHQKAAIRWVINEVGRQLPTNWYHLRG